MAPTFAAAHLDGAELADAHLDNASLASAHLESANLEGAHLDGAERRRHSSRANLGGTRGLHAGADRAGRGRHDDRATRRADAAGALDRAERWESSAGHEIPALAWGERRFTITWQVRPAF